MFGRKQKEIDRLRARVAELEAELKEVNDEFCPPGSFDHFFKEPPRKYPKSEPELSSEEYKKQVLEPMGYKFVSTCDVPNCCSSHPKHIHYTDVYGNESLVPIR